jgi:hypothetical protein
MPRCSIQVLSSDMPSLSCDRSTIARAVAGRQASGVIFCHL